MKARFSTSIDTVFIKILPWSKRFAESSTMYAMKVRGMRLADLRIQPEGERLMHERCGIWIDHREALIVRFAGGDYEVERIQSPVESRHKSTGGSLGSRPYVHRSVNSAARSDQRRHNEWHRHYQTVLSKIHGVNSVFILGPGPAKKEFATFLRANAETELEVSEVRPAKRMTSKQLIAAVREAFERPTELMN